WCTASPATGTANGTVTVDVTENATTETRTATVTIAAGSIAHIINVSQAVPPPTHAASTQTWTFGNQTWSDAIQIPSCNQTTFVGNFIGPQCRSYTSGINTWYYYNWKYVDDNKSTLCPSPWHVPNQGDIAALVANTDSDLLHTWGYGGHATGNSMFGESTQAYYWTLSTYGPDASQAYIGAYENGSMYQSNISKDLGLQVRCVK
ncbi:MAG: hypothetical protein LBO71_10790, partial [Prevotellaceae bacterium]|nr:hypothetical protein [Prevotellaceae bacterium]